jgi:hypothetical protein
MEKVYDILVYYIYDHFGDWGDVFHCNTGYYTGVEFR